jgi:AraC family transcriptional regulator
MLVVYLPDLVISHSRGLRDDSGVKTFARQVLPVADPRDTRMNRVLDFIEANLDTELSLATLASQAAYSPCHFQREFLAWCGESPNALVRRRRLEAGGSRLRFSPSARVGDVALGVGFGSAESFARAFRAHFGMTPSEWRDGGFLAYEANQRHMPEPSRDAPPPVQVRQCAPFEVAYARVNGSYDRVVDAGWRRFLIWVTAAGLAGQPLIGIGLDDPSITPSERCRFDMCVVLPANWQGTTARVARRRLPGGRYACMPFPALPEQALASAWMALLTDWLPLSGHALGDGHFLQVFEAGVRPFEHAAPRCELRMPLLR